MQKLDIWIYDWLFIAGSDFINNKTGRTAGAQNTYCMSDCTMRFVRLNRE